MESPHSAEGPRGSSSRRADGPVPQPPGAVGGPAVRSAGVAAGPWLGVGLGAVGMRAAGCEVPRFNARPVLQSSRSAAGCPRVPGTAPSGPRGSAAPYGVSKRRRPPSARGTAAGAGEGAESDISKKKVYKGRFSFSLPFRFKSIYLSDGSTTKVIVCAELPGCVCASSCRGLRKEQAVS